MKKKLIVTLLLATILSVSACGKSKDTGVIVDVKDSGVDTAANEKITANDSAVASIDSEVSEDNTIKTNENGDTTVTRSESVLSTNPDKAIYGTWVESGTGTIYEFSIDSRFSGYDIQSDSSFSGTFESDLKTYINLVYDPTYEEVEVTDESTGDTYIDSAPQEAETKNCSIKSFNIDGDTATMIIVKDGNETTLIRDASLPANSDDRFKNNIEELNNQPKVTEETEQQIGTPISDEEMQQFLESVAAQTGEPVEKQPEENNESAENTEESTE